MIQLLATSLIIFSVISNGYAINLNDSITKALNANPNRPFNGVVIISKDRVNLYTKSQGKYGQPQVNSQFVIGSISKQFTAVIILQLVDRGLIDLEKPIGTYLPELHADWSTEVKVKHLLNHTSGIVALDKPLAFTPGSQFMYSSTLGYDLASQIAEHVSGLSYEKLLDALFKRAKMPDSSVLNSVNMDENYRAHPHLVKGFKEDGTEIKPVITMGEEGKLYDRSWNPGGGVISTAHDLIVWNEMLHQGHILSKNSYKQMINPSSEREHLRYGKIGYGFGVQLLEKDGCLEISHSGYIDGYSSTLIYYPQSKISIVILENVSWDIADVKRVYKVHDDVRNIIRKKLDCTEDKLSRVCVTCSVREK